jgi:hypothetical protein
MPTPLPTEITVAAHRLRVDAWTGKVVAAMRESGIRAVLLKGPVIARWLYAEDSSLRDYVDGDLIVSPADTARARALLCELGFDAVPHPPLDDHACHARSYVRPRDGAKIDLHTTLHGLERVPRELSWRAVSTSTETVKVGMVDVEIPSRPVCVLHLALHLGPADHAGTQPWLDLERGISITTADEWHAATALARSLGVEQELAVRLRRLPAGAELADRLGLTRRVPANYRLRAAATASDAPRGVLSVLGFIMLPGRRSRLAYARSKLLPEDSVLCEHSALARAGHVRAARALHAAQILIDLPKALLACVTYRRGY